MQDYHLYEYAVIRVVPKVEREEFMNVGVVLYCASKKFLEIRCELNAPRLTALSETMDLEEIQSYLSALCEVCVGGKKGGTIGSFPISSRFRWMTATRSSVIQTSKVHPGFCLDPAETLENLFQKLVK
jgi:hypothetical protein